MEDESTEAEATPEPVDPLALVQDALARGVDDGSLCVGFAVVAEWLEQDGTSTISVMNSPMPPWHLYGLLTFGREYSQSGGQLAPVVDFQLDDEDDDDF